MPCLSPSHCDAEDECLAHRCVPLGAEPVPAGSERRVVDATAVAVVGSAASGLPPVVNLGGPTGGETLLVQFPGAWRELEVEAAFLLLSPARSTEPSASDIPLEVSLASGAWTPSNAHAASAKGPTHEGLARTSPPALLRLDVTPQIRALRGEPSGSLRVRATSSTERGAVYLTGANGGRPRLDIYGR